MALSGNFSGKTSNQFVKPTIYWSAVQNLLENYSDVTVELRYSRTNTGYTTQGSFSGAIYIDKGLSTEQKVTGKKSVCTVTYKSNTLAMTAAFRVYHESNGSKSITISATGAISGTSVESTTISQLITLDTIPRASSIGATDANIGATSMVVVTKKNPTYKHSVAYRFGALSGYIKADGTVTDSEVIFSETSIAFALPDDFYAQIPKAKSDKCTLTCKTYYGSAQIGENQTVTFTAVAAESVCAPNVSGTVVDVNETTKALTGDENKLVRYHSKAKCTITASAKNAATLASETVNGEAISNALEISNVETGRFTFTANDSRGYSKSAIVKKDLIPYVKLTSNATVKRTDPTSGRAVLTVKGNFYNGGFGTEENTLTLSYQVGTEEAVTLAPVISGNTYTASSELTGLAYDQTFPVTVTARDKLETVTAGLTLQKGIPVFDLGEKDFQFHVPVLDQYSTKISNGVAQYSADQIDPNTTLEELILTRHANGPRGSSWSFYIRTIFDSRKSATQGRAQIAEPYGTAGGVYWRVYNGAEWSAWEKLANATDIADFKVKTYSNLSQMGLSGGVTTDAAFSAMPTWSMAVITNSKTNDNYLTDRPTDYCNVVLFKSNANYGSGIATKVGSSAKETYVFDWYNGGSYNGWRPVAPFILWKNTNHTSTFPAHDIAIAGGNCDRFMVLPHVSSNFNDITLSEAVVVHKGESGHLTTLPNNKIARRKFTVNAEGTSIHFEGAEYSNTYGAVAANDMYAVPMYILGL